MKLLLFALFVASVSAAPLRIPTGTCGINKYGNSNATAYIVGGENALVGEFPWQVSLQRSGSHTCGGSIITKNWIMAAAHCFSVTTPSSWKVIAGKHNLRTADSTQVTYAVKKIIKHEGYSSLKSNMNDIALMQLTTDVVYNDYIQPICVPDKGYDAGLVEKDVVATGWGATREGGALASVLQKVTVPVITNESCQKSYPRETIHTVAICAGFAAGGKDACQGDSGGPLVHLNENGTYVQVGITSWGYGCAQKNKPGVYSRVSELSEWVWNTIVKNP